MTERFQVDAEPSLRTRILVEALKLELDRASPMEVPELYSPFEPRIHPLTSRAQEQTIAWAQRMALVNDDRKLRALRESRIAWLAARAFPDAEPAALQLAADWTTLFCLLDDRTEKIDNPEHLEGYLALLLKVLRGGAPANEADGVARALEDIGCRLRTVAPPGWFAIFMARVAELFDAFAEEGRNRAEGLIPEFPHYLKLRAVTVGLRVLFTFGALTDGIQVPEDALDHPTMQSLVQMACNIVGWANDIYTYNKEIRAGEIHNLVVVGINEHQLTLEAAVAWCVDLHDAETRSFEALQGSLPTFDPEIDRELSRYAAMLTAWVRGHLDWAHETGRYATPDGAPPSSQRWEGFIATRRRLTMSPPSSRAGSIPPPGSSRYPTIPPPLSSRRAPLFDDRSSILPPPPLVPDTSGPPSRPSGIPETLRRS